METKNYLEEKCHTLTDDLLKVSDKAKSLCLDTQEDMVKEQLSSWFKTT